MNPASRPVNEGIVHVERNTTTADDEVAKDALEATPETPTMILRALLIPEMKTLEKEGRRVGQWESGGRRRF